MSVGLSAVAIAGVASAGASMYGANKAAKAQENAARSANATQLEMFNVSRDDQAPWRDVGGNALNELAYRLGIEGSGGAKGAQIGLEDLIDTSKGDWRANADLYERSPEYRNAWDQWSAWHRSAYGVDPNESRGSDIEAGRNQLLDFGFNLDTYNKNLPAQRAADPAHGSLLRDFTERDFWSDPVTKLGFQFGLDEGTKGLNRQFSASGSRDSGAALKALTRYATDYTGTKGNEAFNRFNVNRDSQFNKLASLAGVGQAASQQIGNQAIATGQSIAQNQIGAGNARAASSIGMSNALTGAIGQGVNMYQQNQWLNQRNGGYNGYVNNAYGNGFGDAFTNMSNPAYG